MTKLSPAQELELSLAAAADNRYRDGKRALEPEVRREIRERSEYLRKARNDAALAAHESGIPKTQIALLGLHTSNTRTALEAIDEAASRRDALAAADPPAFHLRVWRARNRRRSLRRSTRTRVPTRRLDG